MRTEPMVGGDNASSRSAGILRRVSLLVPLVLVAVTGFRYRHTVDDGFIYYRIVKNVVAGNGPVFNAGERVETFTSPTWLAALSIGDLVLPVRLEWIAVLLGIALSVLGVAAAMRGALLLTGQADDGDRVVVPVGALAFAAPFGVWAWHTAGMENGLVFAWLGCSLLVLARWATERRPLGLAEQVLVGLGWLIRPELVLFSALFTVLVLVGDRHRQTHRQRAATVAGLVAVPVAYQLFRMGYYGSLVANTALAKEGTSMAWSRGSSYFRDFADPYHLWFPMLALAVGVYAPVLRHGDRRRRAVVATFLLGGATAVLWVIYVGGDYLHARLLLPGFFALCAPVAAVTLRRRSTPALLVVPWAVLAVVFLRPPQIDRLPGPGETFISNDPGRVTVDDHAGDRFDPDKFQASLYVEQGTFVYAWEAATFDAAPGLHDPTVVASAIGLTSYALGIDVHIFDTLGLASPIGSRFEINRGGFRLPGHEKPVPPSWLAAQIAAPHATVTPDQLGTSAQHAADADGREPTDDEFAAQIDAARNALRCPPLIRVQRAASADLTPRQFLVNIVRSPENTRTRIPTDPHAALEHLC